MHANRAKNRNEFAHGGERSDPSSMYQSPDEVTQPTKV